MTHLHFAGDGTVINYPIKHQSAAHAATHIYVKCRIEPSPRATQCLGQRGGVRVIFNDHRQAG